MSAEQDRNDCSHNDFVVSSTGRLIDELEKMLRWLNVADEETPIYDQVVRGLGFNPFEKYRAHLP